MIGNMTVVYSESSVLARETAALENRSARGKPRQSKEPHLPEEARRHTQHTLFYTPTGSDLPICD